MVHEICFVLTRVILPHSIQFYYSTQKQRLLAAEVELQSTFKVKSWGTARQIPCINSETFCQIACRGVSFWWQRSLRNIHLTNVIPLRSLLLINTGGRPTYLGKNNEFIFLEYSFIMCVKYMSERLSDWSVCVRDRKGEREREHFEYDVL